MESPDSDLVVSTATLLERVSILICVPSGAMNCFDWLLSDARFLVVFLIHLVAAVIIFAEVPAVATGGLDCWGVSVWSDKWAIFSGMAWGLVL